MSSNEENKTKVMKAIHVNGFARPSFQNLDDVLSVQQRPLPVCQPSKSHILVQVLACSISPGDTTIVRGNLVFLRQPFPFVPGMDICGRVVDPNGSTRFRKGDVVVASNESTMTGGMAEFMIVDEKDAVLKPLEVGVNEGASCSSAITARNAVMDNVNPGDRVLILGGSGGVGYPAIQFAKYHAKASFVATTSTQQHFCKAAGADLVLDYRKYEWWKHSWEMKFDKIIDTVGCGNFDNKAHRVLKSNKDGGAFIAVTGDDPTPDVSSWWKVLPFALRMMKRPLVTSMFPRRYPKYVGLLPYNVQQGRQAVLDLMASGKLQIAIDQSCPLPFSEDGVHDAFLIVASGHAHGKVVVSMVESEVCI